MGGTLLEIPFTTIRNPERTPKKFRKDLFMGANTSTPYGWKAGQAGKSQKNGSVKTQGRKNLGSIQGKARAKNSVRNCAITFTALP